MPVPTLISELSTTAASNSPVGSVDTPSTLDNYQRAHASFIAQLRDSVADIEDGTTTVVNATNATTAAACTGNSATATTATTATAANGINTATTTVSVSAATAPSNGQVLTATGSTAATWQTPSSGLAAGSQADLEAASSNTVAATPSNAKYHPGVAKAYVYFDGSGNILRSYGVSGVTHNGTGDFTISFSVTFSDAYYTVSFMGDASGGSFDNFAVAAIRSAATTTCRIMTGSYGTGATIPQDKGMRVVFFGDLA